MVKLKVNWDEKVICIGGTEYSERFKGVIGHITNINELGLVMFYPENGDPVYRTVQHHTAFKYLN